MSSAITTAASGQGKATASQQLARAGTRPALREGNSMISQRSSACICAPSRAPFFLKSGALGLVLLVRLSHHSAGRVCEPQKAS